MLKTIKDIENMRKTTRMPYGDNYTRLIEHLVNIYINKPEDMQKVKHELLYWDKEAQEVIIRDMIIRIKERKLRNFNEDEFKKALK